MIGGLATTVAPASGAATGVQIGLVLTAVGLGFRHGIDWDHLAALTDITGSQERKRRSMLLATMYALGHALMVFVLGVVAIVASAKVPQWLDDAMGRVVGITLLALGIFVIVNLARRGRDFRMRSRWMLVFAGARRAARWAATYRAGPRDLVVITHEHDHDDDHGHDHGHDHDDHDHDHARTDVTAGAAALVVAPKRHRHLHQHVGTVPDDPFATYGRGTAFGVGVLHGVGAETPTQVLLFLAAARAGGSVAGVLLLVCFIAGLVASNTVVAMTASVGLVGAGRNFPVYATVSVVAAVFSLVVGTIFLLGQAPLLPPIIGT
jgi:high-affinity nickel-transport protein